MKYLLLAYVDERQWETLPDGEHEAQLAESLAAETALAARGCLLAKEQLHNSRTATTVRVHLGKVSIGDGPAAATREQIALIFTIRARDLNEAIQVAAQMPQARNGCIEIRPLMDR